MCHRFRESKANWNWYVWSSVPCKRQEDRQRVCPEVNQNGIRVRWLPDNFFEGSSYFDRTQIETKPTPKHCPSRRGGRWI